MGRFTFKQFEVCDDNCGMKVGTDSVLLGSWAPIDRCHKILDIGAGCGILSLMSAQRNPLASVTAIEIDTGACEDARKNIDNSLWSNRIKLIRGDVLDNTLMSHNFDFIISNPPFFTETLQSPDANRAIARHGAGFDVIKLIEISPKLLSDSGMLAFIAPVSRADEIDFAAALARMDIIAKCDVRQRDSRPVVRQMYLLSKVSLRLNLPTDLIISDATGYTSAYRQLTSQYYLKF